MGYDNEYDIFTFGRLGRCAFELMSLMLILSIRTLQASIAVAKIYLSRHDHDAHSYLS